MEELGAQPLLPPPQIGPGQVRLRPLPPQLLPGPGEDRLVHEVRLADEGDPAETALVRQGPAVKARLVRPPQPLQRRHHVLEVARQGPPSQLAHLHREAQAVQQLQGLPVAGGGVGVPRPLHREKTPSPAPEGWPAPWADIGASPPSCSPASPSHCPPNRSTSFSLKRKGSKETFQQNSVLLDD